MRENDEPRHDRALSDLPNEIPPPPALERRTLAELRRRGLVGESRRPARSLRPTGVRLAAAAAVAAVAALSFGLGYSFPRHDARTGSVTTEDQQRYLLLLYEPRPIERAGLDLVGEYSAWARSLARDGKLVVAEKLSLEELRLGAPEAQGGSLSPASSAAGGPTGFFLLRASSPEEAERIARSCPHLAHGGEVSLRPVADT